MSKEGYIKTFFLHDLGEGLEEVDIVKWLVSEGGNISEGDVFVEVETAKALTEIPSPFSGIVHKLYGNIGDTVNVGERLIDIDVSGGKKEVTGPAAETNTETEEQKTERNESKSTEQRGNYIPPGSYTQETLPPLSDAAKDILQRIKASARADGDRIKDSVHNNATPAVRKRAQDLGVGFDRVSEGGSQAVTELLSGFREAMAEEMKRSREVVRATLFDSADVCRWPRSPYRGSNVTARAIRAIVEGCRAVPIMNAWYDSEEKTLTKHSHVHIGIAVDNKRRGLFVPILGRADSRDEADVMHAMREIKEAVISGKRYQDGWSAESPRHPTISLSNFGTLGAGTHAELVLLPPQVAIVGIGRKEEKEAGYRTTSSACLPLSLTFDHRVITGGEAARFLAVLKGDIEKRE